MATQEAEAEAEAEGCTFKSDPSVLKSKVKRGVGRELRDRADLSEAWGQASVWKQEASPKMCELRHGISNR